MFNGSRISIRNSATGKTGWGVGAFHPTKNCGTFEKVANGVGISWEIRKLSIPKANRSTQNSGNGKWNGNFRRFMYSVPSATGNSGNSHRNFWCNGKRPGLPFREVRHLPEISRWTEPESRVLLASQMKFTEIFVNGKQPFDLFMTMRRILFCL